MRLIPPSLACLELLVAGKLAAVEQIMGLAFQCLVWPDDAEMREGLAVHLGACAQHPRDLVWRVFLIADERDTVVGHAGFKGAPGRSSEVEIYWCVEPRWRGQGIARATAARLCAYAFDHDAVTAVTATIARRNVASQHVAAALGMQPVGGELKHGLPLWRVQRDDWRPPDWLPLAAMPVIAGVPPP